MPAPADLSVVIPARNAAATLGPTLRALDAQQAVGEVVVVDNGSRDATAVAARAGGARVVAEPRRGRPVARNTGARATSGPLLAFLDADCVPAPGWAAELVAALQEAELAAGPVWLRASEQPGAVERFELAWRLRQERTVQREGWGGSGNLAVRRSAFDALGGFDERFRHAAEDVDLGLRARAAGFGLAFCPRAVVEHPAERRLGGVLRRAVRQGHGSAEQHRLTGGRHGRRYWRHPGPLLRGDWALRGLGVDVDALPPGERRRLLALARLDYTGRVAGSLIALVGRSSPPSRA